MVDIYAARRYGRDAMKKTMMYLPDDMHRYLSEEAARTGVSMAEIAREAIAQYRTAREAAQPRQDASKIIGCLQLEGPPTDDASHIDEIMEEYFKPGGGYDQEHGLADSD